MKISASATTLTKRGLIAEASSLGLKPGEFPDEITVIDARGFEFLFGRKGMDVSAGEVAGVIYSCKTGAKLIIVND